jgi:hypothetical protein
LEVGACLEGGVLGRVGAGDVVAVPDQPHAGHGGGPGDVGEELFDEHPKLFGVVGVEGGVHGGDGGVVHRLQDPGGAGSQVFVVRLEVVHPYLRVTPVDRGAAGGDGEQVGVGEQLLPGLVQEQSGLGVDAGVEGVDVAVGDVGPRAGAHRAVGESRPDPAQGEDVERHGRQAGGSCRWCSRAGGDGAQGVASSLVVDEPGCEQRVEGSAEQVGVLVAEAGAGVDAVDEQRWWVCRSRRGRRSTPAGGVAVVGLGDEHVQGGGGAGEREPLPGSSAGASSPAGGAGGPGRAWGAVRLW